MQYIGLYLSYGIIAAIVLFLTQRVKIWESESVIEFEKPLKEFFILLSSIAGVLVLGQLYMADIRFNSANPLLEAINQFLIFSPAVILLLIRHKGLATAWISPHNAHFKLLVGLALAITGIFIHSVTISDHSFFHILKETYSFKNFPHLVQVLLEDILIAALFIRLKKATSLRTALIIVSSLFAAGHIPAMISEGNPVQEFYSLFLDAGLGFFVIYAIDKTKDILWFWMVHFAMDMMQFYA